MDAKYQKVLDWIDESEHERADVLIALKLDEVERDPPASRGKLKTGDYAKIIYDLIKGVPAKALATDYGVSAARISEIKREKSIPMAALRDYLEAKAKANMEVN